MLQLGMRFKHDCQETVNLRLRYFFTDCYISENRTIYSFLVEFVLLSITFFKYIKFKFKIQDFARDKIQFP